MIQSIALDKLVAHPDNPNQMSRANFTKLVRNIERSGLYEPIIVRPHPVQKDSFEIINGHHRYMALSKLGFKMADCVVWQVDDEQTDILLSTLNRLCGTDKIDKKLAVLKRLNEKLAAKQLSKLLPQTAKQIERLISLNRPRMSVKTMSNQLPVPLVFFVDDSQKQVIESAISKADGSADKTTKVAKRAKALTNIAQNFLKKQNCQSNC